MLTLKRKSSPADRGTTAIRIKGPRGHMGREGTWDLLSARTTNTRLSNNFLITNRPEANPASREVADVQRYFYTFNTHNVFLRARSKHFCILETTYIDRNWKQACSLLRRWLESVTFDQHAIHFNIPDDRLTQEGGHRTQEEGGKAPPAEIQEGGNREVRLACQVARMASGVSQMRGARLLESEDVTVSDNPPRLKIRKGKYTTRTGRHHSHSTPSWHPATRASRKLRCTRKRKD
jgi:hypothetical protein